MGYAEDMDLDAAERAEYESERSRDEAEYQRGRREVEEIQAISAPGSRLRDALYLQMEQDAYNRGEDG
jgi:hypothetical protein